MGAREYLGAISGRRIMISIFRDFGRFFGAMHASGRLDAELCSIMNAVGKREFASCENKICSRII